MRITLAASIYPPEVGGPALYAKNLAEALSEEGHRVRVVRYGALKYLPSGVRHLLYALKLLPAAFSSDAVIAFDTVSTGLPAALVSIFTQRPLIIRIGGDFVWESYVERTRDLVPLPDFYRVQERWGRREKIFFGITRWVRKHAVLAFSTRWQLALWSEAYRLDQKKTRVIENAKEAPLQGVPPTRKNFIFFTRQIALKNHAAFRRAFEVVQREFPDITLEEGIIPHGELMERMRSCYAVALPSVSEVSPNYIIDALRCGKPVLLTKHSGYAEPFKEYGVLVDPLSEEDMARGLRELLDPVVYERLKRNIAGFKEVRTYADIAREFTALARKP